MFKLSYFDRRINQKWYSPYVLRLDGERQSTGSEGVKKSSSRKIPSFARKDEALGKTLERHLSHLNSTGINANNPKD
jgi:hypothetical protein